MNPKIQMKILQEERRSFPIQQVMAPAQAMAHNGSGKYIGTPIMDARKEHRNDGSVLKDQEKIIFMSHVGPMSEFIKSISDVLNDNASDRAITSLGSWQVKKNL